MCSSSTIAHKSDCKQLPVHYMSTVFLACIYASGAPLSGCCHTVLAPSMTPCCVSPCGLQAEQGYEPLSAEYPDLPDKLPEKARRNTDMWAAVLEATVVGRQFHRGSGDRPFMSVPTYPKFEGRSLQVSGHAYVVQPLARPLLIEAKLQAAGPARVLCHTSLLVGSHLAAGTR